MSKEIQKFVRNLYENGKNSGEQPKIVKSGYVLKYDFERSLFEFTVQKNKLTEKVLIDVVCSLIETIKQINDQQYKNLNLLIVNNDTSSDVFFQKMKRYFMNTSSADALFYNDQYTEDKQGYVISIEIAKRNMEKFKRTGFETFISTTYVGALLTDIEVLLDSLLLL